MTKNESEDTIDLSEVLDDLHKEFNEDNYYRRAMIEYTLMSVPELYIDDEAYDNEE